MNARQRKVLAELVAIDKKISDREADIVKLKRRRSAVWARGHNLGLKPADLAGASQVATVTVRQTAYRARLAEGE